MEIAHVLFVDIVGYSELLMDEQSEAVGQLNRLVRDAEAVRAADTRGHLIRLPTGDGMALVFTDSLETPVEAALQISRALRKEPGLGLRMGIHSGPMQHTSDVNDRANIAGAGINIAQRVMDCGDAGHILISKHVAEDLEHYGHWKPHLHPLGECEVKHGLRISLVNFYSDDFGNPDPPQKCGSQRTQPDVAGTRRVSELDGSRDGNALPRSGSVLASPGSRRRTTPAGPSAVCRTGLREEHRRSPVR